MCQHHKKENRNWSRRNFIQKVGFLTGASLFLSQLPVRALAKDPIAHLFPKNNTDNILVLIQLEGGNDGLNTIIPLHDYNFYKAKRPKIHIPKSEIISLNNDFGIPTSMKPLKSLWDKGMMKIVNGVGYPNPNLSHFRSADIWSTSSDSKKMIPTGWLGRYLSDEFPNYQNQPPKTPAAIQIGGDSAGMGDRYFPDPLVDAAEESQDVVDEFFSQANEIAKQSGSDIQKRKEALKVYKDRRKSEKNDGVVNGFNNW